MQKPRLNDPDWVIPRAVGCCLTGLLGVAIVVVGVVLEVLQWLN